MGMLVRAAVTLDGTTNPQYFNIGLPCEGYVTDWNIQAFGNYGDLIVHMQIGKPTTQQELQTWGDEVEQVYKPNLFTLIHRTNMGGEFKFFSRKKVYYKNGDSIGCVFTADVDFDAGYVVLIEATFVPKQYSPIKLMRALGAFDEATTTLHGKIHEDLITVPTDMFVDMVSIEVVMSHRLGTPTDNSYQHSFRVMKREGVTQLAVPPTYTMNTLNFEYGDLIGDIYTYEDERERIHSAELGTFIHDSKLSRAQTFNIPVKKFFNNRDAIQLFCDIIGAAEGTSPQYEAWVTVSIIGRIQGNHWSQNKIWTKVSNAYPEYLDYNNSLALMYGGMS